MEVRVYQVSTYDRRALEPEHYKHTDEKSREYLNKVVSKSVELGLSAKKDRYCPDNNILLQLLF